MERIEDRTGIRTASHRGVIWQLKDLFGLERHRAKTLGGLLARVAAKVTAYTCGQVLARSTRQTAAPSCRSFDLNYYSVSV